MPAIRRLALLSIAAALTLVACGGSPAASAPPDPTAGTVSGTVHGTSWTTLSNAYWIGKNLPGGPAATVFLFEASVKCSDIVNVNWDKTATGSRQILEISFLDQVPKTYQIMTDVIAAYLLGNYNPDAFTGTVSITAVNPMVNMTGSFDLGFLGDSLKGTFDAKYCADGVEP
jgi:hypothetical protein